MLRTRLVWFALGFSVSGAAITRFVWKDILTHRQDVSADVKQKFDDLEARVLNLETESKSSQVEG